MRHVIKCLVKQLASTSPENNSSSNFHSDLNVASRLLLAGLLGSLGDLATGLVGLLDSLCKCG